ncbi:hypothetical protein Tco_1404740 [Tanacetum coccineum]
MKVVAVIIVETSFQVLQQHGGCGGGGEGGGVDVEAVEVEAEVVKAEAVGVKVEAVGVEVEVVGVEVVVVVVGTSPSYCNFQIRQNREQNWKEREKPEAKGTKGLKTELKRTFPDRLDNVCAINEVKTKSKSTPGYGFEKGIEKQT